MLNTEFTTVFHPDTTHNAAVDHLLRISGLFKCLLPWRNP